MDRRPPIISVLIATRGRRDRLLATMAGLAGQSADPVSAEVLVGLDGADLPTEEAARDAWREAGGAPRRLRVLTCARTGPAAVRHRLVQEARGRIMVALHDDTRPDPDLLEAHLREQQASAAIVVGAAPYAPIERPTAIDRLVAGSAWAGPGLGANWSAPLAAVRNAGGVPAVDGVLGGDDVELALRLRPLPVQCRPGPRVMHDRRYDAAALLHRERALGAAARRYARLNGDFGPALFGADIASDAYRDTCRRELDLRSDDAAGWERAFLALDRTPGADVDPRALWATFRPLQRRAWMEGLCEAAEHVAATPRMLAACAP